MAENRGSSARDLEIVKDQMLFEVIARPGQVVDSGTIERQAKIKRATR